MNRKAVRPVVPALGGVHVMVRYGYVFMQVKGTIAAKRGQDMSTATEEATENRHAKYAMKFWNDSGGNIPTDAKLAEVLAGCARPPKPEEFRAIRQHVYTYLEGREARGRKACAMLRERADSYASDARKFSDMPRLRLTSEALTEDECKSFAVMYRTIAAELRKVAASL